MARLALIKTGRLPKALEDYPPLVIYALFLHDDDMLDELHDAADEWEEGRGFQSRHRRSFDPDRPVDTGDPVANEWEKEIAEGRLPDWMMEDS